MSESHHEPGKKDAKLRDGYCRRCDMTVTTFAVQYPYDHPEHYDGTSEYQCGRCGRREGRWSGKVLTSNGKGDTSSEPRFGIER